MSKWTPEDLAEKRAEYARRKLAGLCVTCAAGLQDDDGLRCVECSERIAEGKRKSRRKVCAARIAAGQCLDCPDRAEANRRRCSSCLTKHAAHQLARKRWTRVIPIRPAQPVELEPAPVELTKQAAMLRALSHWDWATMSDLFFAMSIEDGRQSEARNAAAVMLGRLVKMGQAESQGPHGERLYRITPAGRALIADKLRRVA